MNLLKQLRVTETGVQKPISSPRIIHTCEQASPDALGGIATRFEFLMTLGVEVRFWANRAEYHGGAREAAERALLHTLYVNTLAKIDAVSHAIFSGDEEGALSILSELRKELSGRS